MKKILLSIISILLIATAAYAYETVLIDFPKNEDWVAILYEKQGSEAILQYAPRGQTPTQWGESLVFHSYKNTGYVYYNDAAELINVLTSQMESENGSGQYRFIKYNGADSIATRCVQKNANIPTQCEILRTSKSFEGIISMHYINKNTQDFKRDYNLWLYTVRNIRIYRSYYRDNRIMDKETNFEL